MRRSSRSQHRLSSRKRKRKRKISAVSRIRQYTEAAQKAGRMDAERAMQLGEDPLTAVHARWVAYCSPRMGLLTKGNWKGYVAAAQAYLRSFCFTTGLSQSDDTLLLPTSKKVAVITTVMNEEKSLPSILEQLQRMPLAETIFVINGSQDNSFELIRGRSQAWIVHYRHPIGHDVGRAIGAKLASADILVFMDADFTIHAEQLLPFIHAIDTGYDLALNDLRPLLPRFSEWDTVTIVKAFLNRVLGRRDLQANSLTAVPHALSRKAVEEIGYDRLVVPPKAQAYAIESGLRICCPASVDVVTVNRIRKHNIGITNKVSELIIGDHIEALHMVMEAKGKRLRYEDVFRRRHVLRR